MAKWQLNGFGGLIRRNTASSVGSVVIQTLSHKAQAPICCWHSPITLINASLFSVSDFSWLAAHQKSYLIALHLSPLRARVYLGACLFVLLNTQYACVTLFVCVGVGSRVCSDSIWLRDVSFVSACSQECVPVCEPVSFVCCLFYAKGRITSLLLWDGVGLREEEAGRGRKRWQEMR